MEPFFYLVTLFFLTALLYASAGFGGGSTYLALLVLFQFPYESTPKIALLCNIVVVSGGFYHYLKAKQLSLRQVLPFILTSVPFAYWGGCVPIGRTVFLWGVALSLGIAGLRLLFRTSEASSEKQVSKKTLWILGLPAGAILGFISGLVGIGGGIFLAPLLYGLRWGSARNIAAACSFFIWVNSVAGLLGHWHKHGALLEGQGLLPLVVAVFMGGQIGSRWSAYRLSPQGLQRITALLVLGVAGKTFWELL